jgi:LTXXQ motif family protein
MTIRFSLAAALLAVTTGLAMAQSAPEPRVADPNAAPAQKPAMPHGPAARTPARPAPHGMMGPDGMMNPHRTLPSGHPQVMGYGMMQIHAGMGDAGFGPMGFDHIEGRIAFLKAEIGVTEAQTPQWNAFADALRTSATAMRGAMTDCAADGGPQSAPDRADAIVRHMSAQVAAMQTVLAAERPLYAALSEEQRKAADELLDGSGMVMMGGPR